MEKTWIKTDDLQFLSKVDEENFNVINVQEWDDEEGKYLGLLTEVNLNDYSEEEIDKVVQTFGYKNMDDLEKYCRNDANQILAECISELYYFENDADIYEDMDDVNKWLKDITNDKSVFIQ